MYYSYCDTMTSNTPYCGGEKTFQRLQRSQHLQSSLEDLNLPSLFQEEEQTSDQEEMEYHYEQLENFQDDGEFEENTSGNQANCNCLQNEAHQLTSQEEEVEKVFSELQIKNRQILAQFDTTGHDTSGQERKIKLFNRRFSDYGKIIRRLEVMRPIFNKNEMPKECQEVIAFQKIELDLYQQSLSDSKKNIKERDQIISGLKTEYDQKIAEQSKYIESMEQQNVMILQQMKFIQQDLRYMVDTYSGEPWGEDLIRKYKLLRAEHIQARELLNRLAYELEDERLTNEDLRIAVVGLEDTTFSSKIEVLRKNKKLKAKYNKLKVEHENCLKESASNLLQTRDELFQKIHLLESKGHDYVSEIYQLEQERSWFVLKLRESDDMRDAEKTKFMEEAGSLMDELASLKENVGSFKATDEVSQKLQELQCDYDRMKLWEKDIGLPYELATDGEIFSMFIFFMFIVLFFVCIYKLCLLF